MHRLLIIPLLFAITTTSYADVVPTEPVDPASTVASDTPTEQQSPQEVIETFHSELLEIMKRSDELGHDGRAEELYPILNAGMDVRALGIGAIGRRTWRTWSEEQKDQFIETFSRFMSATYAARFKQFNGQIFVTTGEREGPRGSLIIQTEMVHPNREPTSLHYLMIKREGSWGIADIFLDGAVSEVAMRRSEFSSVLKSEGFDALIVAIEEKTRQRGEN